MAGLAWVLLGTSGFVREVVHVQGASITACRAGSMLADCWLTASVPHPRHPTLSLVQTHYDPRRMVQTGPQQRTSASSEMYCYTAARVGETVVHMHPLPSAVPLALFVCLFVCLFVEIKPDNLYSASCWEGSKPTGSGYTRAEAQTATCIPKTAAQTTCLSIYG